MEIKNNNKNALVIALGAISAGVLFSVAGRLFLSGSQILNFEDFSHYAVFIGLTFSWLLTVSFIEKSLGDIQPLYKFSIAWLIPVLVICLLGFYNFKLPLNYIGYCGLTIILFFLYSLRQNFRQSIKSYLYGFFAALLMLVIGAFDFWPWVIDTHMIGGAYPDTYRDAAFLQSWDKYEIHSFGVHGLINTTYHPLFALFYRPFLSNLVPIELFNYFSVIITPTLFIFGWVKLFTLSFDNPKLKILFFTLLLFVITLPLSTYFFHQNSFSVSHFVSIPAIALLIAILKRNAQSNIGPVIWLALITPIITLARAFDGLFWIACLVSLSLIYKGKNRAIIIAVAFLNFIFLYGYYTTVERISEHTSPLTGAIKLLYYQWGSLSLMALLAAFTVVFFISTFKKYDTDTSSQDHIFNKFCLYMSLFTLALTLFSQVLSDAFYQIIPYFIVLFFLLIAKKQQFLSNILLGITDKEKVKFLTFIVVFIIFNFIGQLLHHANNSLKEETAFLKNYLYDDKDNKSCTNLINDPFCLIRSNLLGSEMDWQRVNEAPSLQIINHINENFDTSTDNQKIGVFIDPKHSFWLQKQKRVHIHSLIIMAETGFPLIYGIPETVLEPPHSLRRPKRLGGLLKTIDFSSIQKSDFCTELSQLHLDSVIIFQDDDYSSVFLNCNK